MTTTSRARSEARVRARRCRRATGWPTSPCAHKRPTRAHPRTGPPTRGSWVPSCVTTLQASGEPNSTRRHESQAPKPEGSAPACDVATTSPASPHATKSTVPERPLRPAAGERGNRSQARSDRQRASTPVAPRRPSPAQPDLAEHGDLGSSRPATVDAGPISVAVPVHLRSVPRRRPQSRSHDGPCPRADGRLEEPWPFIVSRPFVEGPPTAVSGPAICTLQQ